MRLPGARAKAANPRSILSPTYSLPGINFAMIFHQELPAALSVKFYTSLRQDPCLKNLSSQIKAVKGFEVVETEEIQFLHGKSLGLSSKAQQFWELET